MTTRKTDPRTDPEHYFRNRKQLGERAAAALRSGKTVVVPDEVAKAQQAAKRSRPITIRLTVGDIELAKRQAELKGLPYQTYLKSVLHQALAAEG